MIQVLEILGIAAGVTLAAWGLFHQLIVGAAATMFKEMSEKEARLFVMTWVAQGAFMSFTGILAAVLLFFYGLQAGPVQITLLLTGLAMLLLSGHVFVTGYKSHVGPIRTGAVLELIFGIVCLVSVFVSNPVI
ncbi:MAG: hypothetical protein RIF32_18245 [Leptospirales bacterium]|jgi:hypothetical protein